MNVNKLFAVLALAGMAAPALAADSQTDSGFTSSGWRVECANAGKTLDCKAIEQVVDRANSRVLASMTVRVPAETKRAVMLVQLPLGISVSDPVRITMAGTVKNYPIQTCTQTGCFVGSPLSGHTLDQMRNGQQIGIAFKNLDKQTVTVTMPLAGFGPVYDKIR